jgi:hypothetical protein
MVSKAPKAFAGFWTGCDRGCPTAGAEALMLSTTLRQREYWLIPGEPVRIVCYRHGIMRVIE